MLKEANKKHQQEGIADEQGVIAKFEDINPKDIRFAVQNTDSGFWNARTTINPEKMEKIRKSIRDEGLTNNLSIRVLPNGKYELVCGEQRLRCILSLLEKNELCHSDEIGRKLAANVVYRHVHCRVLYNCSDKEASRRSVAENLERDELNEVDLMEYCLALSEKKNPAGFNIYNRDDIGYIIQRSPTWISQTMNLFNLSDRAKAMLADKSLPRTVALNLLKVKKELVDQVLDEAMLQATLAAEEDQNRIEILVQQLEAKYDEASLLLATSEALNDRESAKAAKSVRNEVDRKLKDAQARRATATCRTPRLNTDAIQKATNNIEGARQGKSNGLSQKSLRAMLFDLNQLLEKGEPIIDTACNGEFDNRDIRLAVRIIELITGERIEESLLSLIAKFNANEGIQPWAGLELKLVS